jgi:hypothetical protein
LNILEMMIITLELHIAPHREKGGGEGGVEAGFLQEVLITYILKRLRGVSDEGRGT